ncbi:uncharacterized protein [Procambarus clarkii]|uniref:uncharacterized protein n=1 Tax=Procambarus clarkii TaxID=6728 RepID=UPI0037438098
MSEDEILQSITGEVNVEMEDEKGSEEPTPMTTKYSVLMTYVDGLINFSSNCAHPEVGNMYQYLRRVKELIIQLASEYRRQATLDSYMVRKSSQAPSTSEESQARSAPSTSEATQASQAPSTSETSQASQMPSTSEASAAGSQN